MNSYTSANFFQAKIIEASMTAWMRMLIEQMGVAIILILAAVLVRPEFLLSVILGVTLFVFPNFGLSMVIGFADKFYKKPGFKPKAWLKWFYLAQVFKYSLLVLALIFIFLFKAPVIWSIFLAVFIIMQLSSLASNFRVRRMLSA